LYIVSLYGGEGEGNTQRKEKKVRERRIFNTTSYSQHTHTQKEKGEERGKIVE